MKRVCVVLLACVMSLTAYGGFADTPHVAGSLQGWDPGANPMTETSSGSGIWEASFSGLGLNERHEFKITQGDWGDAYPYSGNSWLFTDGAGDVTITFNANAAGDGWLPDQYRLGLSTDPGSWSIVGDLNGWNNADPAWAMTAQGGGIYKLTQSLTAGTYNWKAVVTGSWDALGNDGRSINADNLSLALAADGNVDFYVDALNGSVKVVPEPATMLMMGLGSLIAIRRKK